MKNPIITLTTDFGVTDHFVGVMKGVILGICPAARIIDISHDVHPFETQVGAYVIAQAYRYFPKKTIHVVVVDPGVGSSRRPILVEAENQYFIGPDNGVLAMVYSSGSHKVREITAEAFFLQPVSHTFHGRDVFAPVAAHVANGTRPQSFGPLIDDYLKPTFSEPQRFSKRQWQGVVLYIDRFGNVITNFHINEFPALEDGRFELTIGALRLGELGKSYAAMPIGEPFVIVGSSGYLEIAANQASAARILGCGIGAPCELTAY